MEVVVGTGFMLPLYPENIHITGIDISTEMLYKAPKKIEPERKTKISLLKVNGENFPFDNKRFSCVTLPYTYSVTPNPEQLISEVRRVCKKMDLLLPITSPK